MAPAPGVSGFMCWMENSFPSSELPVRPLKHGDEIAGLTVYSVPGHTAGSIFLHHPPTHTVFTGDTLLSARPPLVFPRGLTLAYPPFCEDRAQALERLSGFVGSHEIRRLCPGHGKMEQGALTAQVQRLLREDPELRIW
jgi:glyoxylase-like metal-dependent hydrolase (beta-lactamase superfamily II)